MVGYTLGLLSPIIFILFSSVKKNSEPLLNFEVNLSDSISFSHSFNESFLLIFKPNPWEEDKLIARESYVLEKISNKCLKYSFFIPMPVSSTVIFTF